LKRRVWRNWPLVLAAGFSVVSVLALGFALSWRSADQEQLERGRRENCQAIEQLKAIQRQAISEDVVGSEEFLRENPNGIPGISPALIQAGIDRDQRSLLNLAPKEC
jgi:hypothetical protein